jgi:N-hydroxyarylamine O-acetyltransferase
MKTSWLFCEDREFYIRYLNILGVVPQKPSFNSLSEILAAHIIHIPFENISKLYYKKKYNLLSLPSFNLYLEGIEKYNFGGTCYSNNYYLHCLLKFFDYDVKLCGAEMNKPDAHLVNIVKLNNKEYLVDAGNAAPFFNPVPLFLKENYEIVRGRELYVFEPQDKFGRTRMRYYRNGALKNSYVVNPEPKNIYDFHPSITDSFNSNALFMSSIYIASISKECTWKIHNFEMLKSDNTSTEKFILSGNKELTKKVHELSYIPSEIIEYVLGEIEFPAEVKIA